MKKIYVFAVAAILLIVSACGRNDFPKVVCEAGQYLNVATYDEYVDQYEAHIDALLASNDDSVNEVLSTGLITVRSYIVVDKYEDNGTIEFWSNPGCIKYEKYANTVSVIGKIINLSMCDDFAREITKRLGRDNDFYADLANEIEDARQDGSNEISNLFDPITGERVK